MCLRFVFLLVTLCVPRISSVCSEQQSCGVGHPAVMITDHVPAVRVSPDHAPSTTATACYVTRRGGVTGRLAPRMLVVYDWCGGDGPAGGGRCAGPGGVAGGVCRVVRAGGG